MNHKEQLIGFTVIMLLIALSLTSLFSVTKWVMFNKIQHAMMYTIPGTPYDMMVSRVGEPAGEWSMSQWVSNSQFIEHPIPESATKVRRFIILTFSTECFVFYDNDEKVVGAFWFET